MKTLALISLLCLNALLIASCGINKDFSKRKYLNLKAPHMQVTVPNSKASKLNLLPPFTSTIGDVDSIEYSDSATIDSLATTTAEIIIQEMLLPKNEDRLEKQLVLIDPIVVDSARVKEDGNNKKEGRTKDPKRRARIILTILLSILVATAGTLGGIYIMRDNAPDGTILGAIWFFFAAVIAIAIMSLAAVIALFLLISVFSAP